MNRRTFLAAVPSLVAAAGMMATSSAAAATPLTISPAGGALPSGSVGAVYGMNLTTVGGGTRPVTWSVISGRLPAGLSIIKNWGNSSTAITGTPTTSGTSTFTVQARDKSGNKATAIFTLTINGALALTVTNPSSTMPAGTVGTAYLTNLFASGGLQPYTWTISAGALPSGLRLTGNQIGGTPTTRGTSTFTARVADSTGQSATKQFSITVS